MLAVIFFALVSGSPSPGEAEPGPPRPLVPREPVEVMIEIVGFVMKLARGGPGPDLQRDGPVRPPVLQKLSVYVLTVYLGYFLFQFGFFGLLVRFGARMSPVTFFRRSPW